MATCTCAAVSPCMCGPTSAPCAAPARGCRLSSGLRRIRNNVRCASGRMRQDTLLLLSSGGLASPPFSPLPFTSSPGARPIISGLHGCGGWLGLVLYIGPGWGYGGGPRRGVATVRTATITARRLQAKDRVPPRARGVLFFYQISQTVANGKRQIARLDTTHNSHFAWVIGYRANIGM
eukprot:scaffold3801_cov124-Isochrysis_galbana.AAC.21